MTFNDWLTSGLSHNQNLHFPKQNLQNCPLTANSGPAFDLSPASAHRGPAGLAIRATERQGEHRVSPWATRSHLLQVSPWAATDSGGRAKA